MTPPIFAPADKSLHETFNASAASPLAAKPKKPRKAASHVISFRVDDTEKSALECSAAGLPLSRYVRERVLNGDHSPRRTRGQSPIKDHEALGRVLGALGRPVWPMIWLFAFEAAEEGAFFFLLKLMLRSGAPSKMYLPCAMI
ncbi:MAG: hypothetical protein H6844_19185 [Alphaproteobacteria bacterium]|nr:hypothetical protein [Alphaproteobacteria bacterium]